MIERMMLAVPTKGEGGLEGERSAHFGHCDCFTLIEIVDGEIVEVRVAANPPHQEGGCLRTVSLLASHGVTALLAAGMGARPLQGFNDVGISVYFESETPGISDAVQFLLQGTVETMDARHACSGH